MAKMDGGTYDELLAALRKADAAIVKKFRAKCYARGLTLRGVILELVQGWMEAGG